jgi:hypothetical protein
MPRTDKAKLFKSDLQSGQGGGELEMVNEVEVVL